MNASLRDLNRRLDALPPTHFDAGELMRQGDARLRRRRVAAATCAAVAVVLVVGLAGAGLPRHEGAQVPAQNPSPTQTESLTGEEWTPERIRAEGSPGDPQGAIPITESGLATRLYVACDGSRCESDSGPHEDMHVALEVTQEGRSAVFDLRWSGQPWVRVFDEDSVLVQDAEGPDQPVRYRLLQADGTEVQLEMVNDPAPPVAGPGLFVIDDFSGWSVGMDGVEDVYLVDERTGTLRPLDVPDEEVRYWGPNVVEFLWGVSSDCRVFWVTSGTVEERRLDCSDGSDFTYMHDGWFPSRWLRPGRMAVAEQRDDGIVVHVSLNRGATWQQIEVTDKDSFPDVLGRLG